ncbi:MAG TPA: DNA-3-methyladenine glycosylase [Coriobacteriia bacterium]|nr:DNA-3-methyladenine glycosylase [Coriobacteriia bacterium]
MDWPDPDGRILLSPAFFARATETVAREVLGKILVSSVGGVLCGGRVVEVEAYLGRDDPGSHAATKGVTRRNAVMYGPPGRAYVYFTYGNHHMLNLVTEEDGAAGAVLVRAIEPSIGVDEMRRRRGGRTGSHIADGPGKVAQALGLDLTDNGSELGARRIAVYEAPPPSESVMTSGRIGLTAGHEPALRFFLAGNEHVSSGKTGPRRTASRSGRVDDVSRIRCERGRKDNA